MGRDVVFECRDRQTAYCYMLRDTYPVHGQIQDGLPADLATVLQVDTYLQTKQMSPFLVNIRSSFMLSAQEAQSQDTRYNVPLLNAFVFYVGIKVSNSTSIITQKALHLSMCV